MISQTCPDQNRSLKTAGLWIGAVILIITPLLAVEPTHHFQLLKPKSALAKQEVQLVIKAVRSDESMIEDAHHDLTLYFTNRKGTTRQDIRLRHGEAALKMTFSETGYQAIQVEDKGNPDHLTLSDLIEVKP